MGKNKIPSFSKNYSKSASSNNISMRSQSWLIPYGCPFTHPLIRLSSKIKPFAVLNGNLSTIRTTRCILSTDGGAYLFPRLCLNRYYLNYYSSFLRTSLTSSVLKNKSIFSRRARIRDYLNYYTRNYTNIYSSSIPTTALLNGRNKRPISNH